MTSRDRQTLVLAATAGLLVFCSLTIGCTSPVDEIHATAANHEPVAPAEPGPGDWPWWRGTHGDGIAHPTANPPTTWSKNKNVAWRTPIPGRGHSSPTLWGSHIFLTTADEDAETQSVLALDRDSGEIIWHTQLHAGGFMRMHPKNSHASPSVATDGQYAYATFVADDAVHLSALTLAGDIAWQTTVGPFKSQHGYGSSPVLHGSYVIVAADQPGSSFLAAVHRRTGKIVWRVARTIGGSYSSPVVATLNGTEQILLAGNYQIHSYDPADGSERWHRDGVASTMANTLAFDAERVYATGGYPEKQIICVDPDSESAEAEPVWRVTNAVAYVPSPLLFDDRLYCVSDNGVASCLETAQGKSFWRKRLGGDVTASPVLAGGHIYVTDESGTTHVYSPGEKFNRVAENDLGEATFATPTAAGSRIYLRTERALYALQAPTDDATPATESD